MSDARDPRSAAPPDLVGETLPFGQNGENGEVSREIVVTTSGAIEGLAPGAMVGDWRIDGKIGHGGMGTVHAATHPVIGKRAAIKVVHADLCRSPLTAERFVQEARVVNQICHPSIVDIFDLGQLPDGRPYLVMELLRGRTLGDRLAQGKMGALEAIDVLLQIADAMAAAHEHAVLHRDLKPDNIYLTEGSGGRPAVKVVDWGIAKLRDTTPKAVALTTSGMILGTPQYVSPEQARGKTLDERTDVYSLGVIAYEMFLEAPPFVAESVADMVAMHLRELPPPPSDVWPDIPAALEQLLLAMLAKEAADRPGVATVIATLREVREELVQRAARTSGRRLAAGSMPPPTDPSREDSGVTALASLAATASVAPATGPNAVAPAPVSAETSSVSLPVVPVGSGSYVAVAPRSRTRWPWLAAGVVVAGGVLAVIALILADGGASGDAVAASAVPGDSDRAGELQTTEAPAPPVEETPPAATPPTSAPPAVRDVVIEVRATPRHARVFVDGAPVRVVDGRASQSVKPGRHEIRVEASGRTSYERVLEVRARTVLEVGLRRESRGSRHRNARDDESTPPTPLDPNATIDPF